MTCVSEQLHESLLCAAALLDYPDIVWRSQLGDLAERIESLPQSHVNDALRAFAEEAKAADDMEFETRYVQLFDMGKATNLCLTGRNRADAGQQRADMIGYAVHYEALGYEPEDVPPDYLPALLELASRADDKAANALFRTAEKDLEALRVSLEAAEISDYELLVAAVQSIAAQLAKEAA